MDELLPSRVHPRELLQAIEKLGEIPQWSEQSERISAQSILFQTRLSAGQYPSIYGVNTLPGHKDHIRLAGDELSQFQINLIENHAIGSAPWFDNFTARCIGYCKVNAIAQGGTGISERLFNYLRRVITDKCFTPLLPANATYSCGDVIPAAHWAQQALEHDSYTSEFQLLPKEGMSLINGNFVHLGVSLSAMHELRNLWPLYMSAMLSSYAVVEADYPQAGKYDKESCLKELFTNLIPRPRSEFSHQHPVSFRALPQLYSSLRSSIKHFCVNLTVDLNSESDNPLIDSNGQIYSQASFLAPALSISSGALIESMLLQMWASAQRVKYTLSGSVQGIPLDGSTCYLDLGLIQVPKLMTAILENVRHRCGRRIFASGGETSYGVEDLWSFGVDTSSLMLYASQSWKKICSLELAVSFYLLKNFREDRRFFDYIGFPNDLEREDFMGLVDMISAFDPKTWVDDFSRLFPWP